MVDLTVLIATHNGADVIERTLDGYCELGSDPASWKLVIVNNASTDETGAILERYEDRLPLTIVDVPTPGKNAALTIGMQSVEGDFVILSDDDAIPQAGFLDQWRDAMSSFKDMDVMGGSIDLVFDTPPPNWLLQEKLRFEELYALRDNIPAGPIDPLGIYGPNMAVRKHVFSAGVYFDPSIGPNGADKNYGMGSESAFCTSAAAAGFQTGFAPAPLVHHIVRDHQMTPNYWAKRAFKLGRGVAQRQWKSGILTLKNRSAVVRSLASLHRTLKQSGLYLLTLLPGHRRQFLSQWDYQFFLGFQTEHARQKEAARQLKVGATDA